VPAAAGASATGNNYYISQEDHAEDSYQSRMEPARRESNRFLAVR
jgi:hypothetical protein